MGDAHNDGAPDRCPHCGSGQLRTYRDMFGTTTYYHCLTKAANGKITDIDDFCKRKRTRTVRMGS